MVQAASETQGRARSLLGNLTYLDREFARASRDGVVPPFMLAMSICVASREPIPHSGSATYDVSLPVAVRT